MRKDKKLTEMNRKKKEEAKKAIKLFLKEKKNDTFQKAVSMIDRLAKRNIFHKNKAARLKSRLSKQLKKSS